MLTYVMFTMGANLYVMFNIGNAHLRNVHHGSYLYIIITIGNAHFYVMYVYHGR